MRTLLLSLLVIIFLAPLVTAEEYEVYGKVYTQDNMPLTNEPIVIQCSGNDVCDLNSNLQTITDYYGFYSITLEVFPEDDGKNISLLVAGQLAELTIDWNSSSNSDTRNQEFDIYLTQDPRVSSTIGGFTCGGGCLLLILFFAGLRSLRKLMTQEGRDEFLGRKLMPIADCPVCRKKMPRHLVLRHLIVDHEIEPYEAGAMVGKQFNKIHSEE
ncbi:MAG: hypothetical protein VX655_04070 [Candidatus Thermoplasmatota archaeon]|nr:hypothetical protein [Candidatus Thermoplasmatota archaeon]